MTGLLASRADLAVATARVRVAASVPSSPVGLLDLIAASVILLLTRGSDRDGPPRTSHSAKAPLGAGGLVAPPLNPLLTRGSDEDCPTRTSPSASSNFS